MDRRTLKIEVERAGRWRGNAASGRQRGRKLKGESFVAHPVACSLPEGRFFAMPQAIALSDGSVAEIECVDVFEYIKDDEGLAVELRRLLRPGGRLRVRVPGTGPLAGFDAFNLQRYLVDVTRRGARPHEITELGWRRHYGEDEVIAMLGCDAFRVVSLKRRGLAIAELLTFVAMVLFRWLVPSGDRYQALKRLIDPIERIERRIVTPIGFSIELELERR